MDSAAFIKGMNRVYREAGSSCPACACESPSRLALGDELSEVGELVFYHCPWHPMYLAVSLNGIPGVIMVNSAQVQTVYSLPVRATTLVVTIK